MAAQLGFLAGTPASAVLLQPFIAPAPLSVRPPLPGDLDQRPVRMGVPLGYELRSRVTYHFDPWLLKDKGIIPSLRFIVLGQLGYGKSALLKALTMRLLGMQAGVDSYGRPIPMRARTNNRKAEAGEPEDKPLNDYLLGDIVRLNTRGSINIFDPKMGMSEWDVLETAVNVCELASDKPLVGFQSLALQVAVHFMLTTHREIAMPEVLEVVLRGLTVADIESYFNDSNNDILKSLGTASVDPKLIQELQVTLSRPVIRNIPENEFRRDAALVSTYLSRVLRGDFGQIFGGQNSLREILGQPMVTLDWAGLNGKGRTLLDAMLFKWQTVALNAGNFDLIPHIQTHDESQERLTSVMEARFWSEKAKKARASHEFEMIATQYRADISQAGAEGSEIRSLAQGILNAVGGYFIFRQPDNERTRNELSQLGISNIDIDTLTGLPVGCCGLFIPGQPLALIDFRLTPTELKLVQTNAANDRMLERVSIEDMPEHIQRAERM